MTIESVWAACWGPAPYVRRQPALVSEGRNPVNCSLVSVGFDFAVSGTDGRGSMDEIGSVTSPYHIIPQVSWKSHGNRAGLCRAWEGTDASKRLSSRCCSRMTSKAYATSP